MVSRLPAVLEARLLRLGGFAARRSHDFLALQSLFDLLFEALGISFIPTSASVSVGSSSARFLSAALSVLVVGHQ